MTPRLPMCPRCGAATSVLESRSTSMGYRRRRRCDGPGCGNRFRTYEIVGGDDAHNRHSEPVIIERSDLRMLFETVDRLRAAMNLDDETADPEDELTG